MKRKLFLTYIIVCFIDITVLLSIAIAAIVNSPIILIGRPVSLLTISTTAAIGITLLILLFLCLKIRKKRIRRITAVILFLIFSYFFLAMNMHTLSTIRYYAGYKRYTYNSMQREGKQILNYANSHGKFPTVKESWDDLECRHWQINPRVIGKKIDEIPENTILLSSGYRLLDESVIYSKSMNEIAMEELEFLGYITIFTIDGDIHIVNKGLEQFTW